MRIQFVPFPAPAHCSLMVPLAWAFQNAGHEVRFVVPPNFVDQVTSTGLMVVPYGGPTDLSQSGAVLPWMARISGLDSNGTPADEELRHLTMAPIVMYFGSDVLKDTTAELIERTRAWGPDLVIWDAFAVQASVAARVSGAASARMIWGFDHPGRMRAAFRERQAREGGEDSVEVLMGSMLQANGHTFDERVLLGDWTVNPLPILGQGSVDVPCVAMRQFAFAHVTEPPAWMLEPSSRPRVCLTLGRSVRDVRNSDNYGIAVEDLFEAVTDLDVEVVATFTSDQLPENVKVPDNVRLVDYVPINMLFPTCSAVIHHSGGTTMMAAMWHKVPQVIIPPKSWGDPQLAQLTADHGAAVIIPVAELTPARLRESLLRVLDDPSFTKAAERLHAATLTLPSPNEAVPILEKLTREAVTASRG